MVPVRGGGRPVIHSRRRLVEAILYVNRTGCSWRQLPHDFPPWDTVYWYFKRWNADGTTDRVHLAMRDAVRDAAGRDPMASADPCPRSRRDNRAEPLVTPFSTLANRSSPASRSRSCEPRINRICRSPDDTGRPPGRPMHPTVVGLRRRQADRRHGLGPDRWGCAAASGRRASGAAPARHGTARRSRPPCGDGSATRPTPHT
ncbi:MAG TPA: transposase [Jiangellaceae bacterium]|nr:transposase [Jiangellaceae bacterium]